MPPLCKGRWVGESRLGGVVENALHFRIECPAGRAYFCATIPSGAREVAKTWGSFDSPPYPLKTTQGLCLWTPFHR